MDDGDFQRTWAEQSNEANNTLFRKADAAGKGERWGKEKMKSLFTVVLLMASVAMAGDIIVTLSGAAGNASKAISTNEVSFGRLNWDGIDGGGQHEITASLDAHRVEVTERTISSSSGIGNDTISKTFIHTNKLPYTFLLSQATVTVSRVASTQSNETRGTIGFAGTNEINTANNPPIAEFLCASGNLVTNGQIAEVVKQADIATIVFPFEIRSAAPKEVWGVSLRRDIDKAKTFGPPPEKEPYYWLEAILVMKDGGIIKTQSSGEWLKVTTASQCGFARIRKD